MLDLGIRNIEKYDDDYTVLYLSDLSVGDEIEGEIHISHLINRRFFVIITNHTLKKKWVCGLNTSVYENDDVVSIYGSRAGRVYLLIDSLNHVLNGTELNMVKSYSVVFETFKNTVNTKIGKAKVVAVSNINSKLPNLKFVYIEENFSESRIKADYKLKGTPIYHIK